jgi:hypothetical protein
VAIERHHISMIERAMGSHDTPLFDETLQTIHERRLGNRKEKRHTSPKWASLLEACPGSTGAHRKKKRGQFRSPSKKNRIKNKK